MKLFNKLFRRAKEAFIPLKNEEVENDNTSPETKKWIRTESKLIANRIKAQRNSKKRWSTTKSFNNIKK